MSWSWALLCSALRRPCLWCWCPCVTRDTQATNQQVYWIVPSILTSPLVMHHAQCCSLLQWPPTLMNWVSSLFIRTPCIRCRTCIIQQMFSTKSLEDGLAGPSWTKGNWTRMASCCSVEKRWLCSSWLGGRDCDPLLDQTWVRLFWALFSTRLRPCVCPCRACSSPNFRKNPHSPSLVFDHPGLPSARFPSSLLNQHLPCLRFSA